MASNHILAVDIGGTKLAAAIVGDDGSIQCRHQVATLASRGADGLFESLARLVDSVRAEWQAMSSAAPVACGVGCGGPMTPNGETVSPVNIEAWRGFRLRSRLEDHVGLPVFVDNDAKALALGEGWCGAARGSTDYLAMVVSTGVGGGIVLDGRLLDGAQGNAGHIGHVIVVPDGRRCGCGASGCLEAEASGIAIEAVTGRPASEAGADVIERTGRLVGRAIASVANLLDLRLAIAAGSVALGFGQPFVTAANDELSRSARLDFSRGAELRLAGLGDAGPLVGAGAVGLIGVGESVLSAGTSAS